jgi:alpha-beta hydrolase superfamily lysophospholipase
LTIQRFILIAMLMGAAIESAAASDCVVLLHGLGRSPVSMLRLDYHLSGSNYDVVNPAYPSTEQPIQQLASVVGTGVGECRERNATAIHFVTHSLGGILVRQYFQNHRVPEARRAVMLAPPNHGSEIVDRHRDEWWYRHATGVAGQQLGTGQDSIPNQLAPIELEIGIIAGTRSSDPWFAAAMRGANDGKVSVDSAKLAEMQDFLLVDSGHTFIMNTTKVVHQVEAFLRNGKFDRSGEQ